MDLAELKAANLKNDPPETREDVELTLRVGDRLLSHTVLKAQTPLEVNTILKAFQGSFGGELVDLDEARATPA